MKTFIARGPAGIIGGQQSTPNIPTNIAAVTSDQRNWENEFLKFIFYIEKGFGNKKYCGFDQD